MNDTCIYMLTTALLVLIVVVYCLCRKIDKVDRKLDDFQSTGDHLKKFSKNLEALFKVEHNSKKG